MASTEHCLYCFETLAARLESRKSLTLEEVEKLWEEYCNSPEAAGAASEGKSAGAKVVSSLKKRIPALRRVAASSSTSTSSSSTSTSTSESSTPSGSGSSSMSLSSTTPADYTPATSTSSLPDTAGNTLGAPQQEKITESPLFVTWNTVSAQTGGTSLRGCMGMFEAQELDEGLKSYAVTSAVDDTRFPAVKWTELSSLEVAVTLLTDFEDCADALDWALGTHGLRISFADRGRRYGATYLPDVAPEQGWTKEETLVSLMRKAGWVGRRDRWQDVDLHVVRYQGKKDALRYPEYKHWRDWVGDHHKGEE
ncbi:AMMECR1 domain-containing protein [Xylariomycetidae sp. FL2044]|nr:AMMECR1 domain-containing protein [Xylariomycetidae sp. FL2044]